MAAFNVDAFRDVEEFKAEVTEFAQYLKSSPPAAGFTEVFYPGEPEHRRTQRLLTEGIVVEDSTWGRLMDLAAELGLADTLKSD